MSTQLDGLMVTEPVEDRKAFRQIVEQYRSERQNQGQCPCMCHYRELTAYKQPCCNGEAHLTSALMADVIDRVTNDLP